MAFQDRSLPETGVGASDRWLYLRRNDEDLRGPHPGLYRVHCVSLTTGNVLDTYKAIG